MNQVFSSLHPNPGWTGASSNPSVYAPSTSNPAVANSSVANSPVSDTVDKHCILELYQCDSARLDDEAFLRTAITAAAKRAGATLLNLITHHFDPQGVTGLALLAESHISIHTWPESGYAAVDVFTCGDHTMPEKACQVLADELQAGHQKLTSFRRETPSALATEVRTPAPLPAWAIRPGSV